MAFKEWMASGFVALALAGLMAVGPAMAQDQEVAASHLIAARKAIDAIESTAQFDNILLNAATQVKADLIGSNPDLQVQISDMVDEQALSLAPRRADLENEVARVYAKLFTEQELGDIATFYASPAGKKLLRQGPLATRDVMSAADVWSNGILRDLRNAASAGMVKLAEEAGVANVPMTQPAGATPVAPAPTKPKTN